VETEIPVTDADVVPVATAPKVAPPVYKPAGVPGAPPMSATNVWACPGSETVEVAPWLCVALCPPVVPEEETV
jgi:hypothetical protein